MTDSLKNVLKVAGSCLDDRLISSNSLFHISQIANLLPTIPTVSEAGFECHLGSSAPRADFLAAFTTLNNGREALINSCEPLTSLLCTNSVWSRIRNFCTHWADIKSSLYNNVGNVWLEFDVDGQPSKVPEPSLFFAPRGIRREEEKLFLSNGISGTNNWVTNEALRLLFGNFLPDEVKKQLLTCFELLPPGGEIFQIGVMLPRKCESQAVRLCVKGIAKEQILAYLRNIGWSGSISQLSSILSELSSFVDDIKLNFAVEDTVFTKIGFECYLDKQPEKTPRWQLFLDYLVRNQLCTLEKTNALLNWSGYSEEKFHQELWPSNFAKASAFVYPSFRSTIVRLLHHIKIVYQPNQPLQAKAYLWFSHRWLSPSGLFKNN
ncbi:hypothetical protein H6F61_21625 [Cyanobacteria bacterium FACHB-472]|nr:hypothetical protein [Cyanobacteria bacterium FACHB-472]